MARQNSLSSRQSGSHNTCCCPDTQQSAPRMASTTVRGHSISRPFEPEEGEKKNRDDDGKNKEAGKKPVKTKANRK
jgi:hypothetical protein